MEFPGGLGKMFEQAMKLQENMSKLQEDLEHQELEASAGGGMVVVKVSGGQKILSLKIDPSVVNPNDIEMLQDLIQAAVNEAIRKSRDLMKSEMSKLTGGLPIPGFN
ncbi:MAG: YbaB/EbfC family nucleoid-associated protein [Bdellovibrionota bacterium]